MKSINILYDSEETINKLIAGGTLNCETPYFIQIITATAGPVKAVEIAQFIQQRFSNATIMGFSSSGLIYKGEQLLDGVLLLFQTFEKTQVFQSTFSWSDKSAAQMAEEITNAIADKTPLLMHLICSDHYYDIHKFVDEFNVRNSVTQLAGGLAGDLLDGSSIGFVFTANGVVKNGIIIAALYGSDFTFYNGINTIHETISNKQTLTKIKNEQWLEINGIEIKQWLFEQLGIDDLESYSESGTLRVNDMLAHFPVVLEGYQSASRFLRYNKEEDSVAPYFTRIPEGTEFRIGYVNPSKCLQEGFRLCNEIMEQPIEEMFCYTCSFRSYYMKNCSDWELKPYKNINLCGAFIGGEIAYVNGCNEFLNGTSCLLGIAENENYIRPDIQAFDEATSIGEDTTNLLNMVLKRQQEATTKQNEELMKTLLKQRERQNEQMYIDFNMGVKNYLKYQEDLKTNNYDKYCIMKTENSQLLITHLGHTAYLQIMRNVATHGQNVVNHLRETEHAMLELYVLNESTFFVAADERMSESHFARICKSVHDANHLLHLEDNNEVVVTRFAMCIKVKEPIESALNALAASKNTQNSFLICHGEDDGVSTDEEFKMIGVLNRAFEKDGIVPYFQGIYSNTKSSITYYEALMRIKDIDGTVYAPGQFIDIAKKYHMYSMLSKIMIGRVFDLFCNLNEAVSINISAFDIQSENTKQLIFERLKACKNPHNFIFEILEDEAYQDFSPLKEFIKNIRELGAKVAIDDFGAGYSNLYEVSSINFEIIKVDGSIIRNLPDNECNRKLLDVITHMGFLFDAQIVAEFVENQEIQNILLQKDIDFSQGYLFAKPLPFEELALEGD